jgi:hypothetical protein
MTPDPTPAVCHAVPSGAGQLNQHHRGAAEQVHQVCESRVIRAHLAYVAPAGGGSTTAP